MRRMRPAAVVAVEPPGRGGPQTRPTRFRGAPRRISQTPGPFPNQRVIARRTLTAVGDEATTWAGGHKSRRILFSETKSGGRGIRTHGDVAATMVFKRIGGSWSIIVATCVVGTRGWPAGQDHPANIPRPVQMCPVGMPHELRIVRVFSCVARGFKARPSFMFAGC